MPSAFAVIHTWPELKNAEYEVLQRVLAAAQRVDIYAVVIDNNGKVLWARPELNMREGTYLQEDAVDFIISLHFESAKLLDIYSYITLWQPIEFYHQFGYQKSIDKLTSHNDLISCDSDLADLHGINLLEGLDRVPLLPLPRMFHSVPEPFLEPKINMNSRLFYIGINWERIGAARGRFHETLLALDKKDITDIYGPELIQGIQPWAGFQTFRGELPFDGNAVRNAINRSGICLALSSAGHKHAGIMSNRLFEGLAGGAAIIASPNALIDKYFADVVYRVDDSRGEAVLAQQIAEAVKMIQSDPQEACRRTLAGQKIMREVCSLEKSLLSLARDTPKRIAHYEAIAYADAAIAVICNFTGHEKSSLKLYIDQFVRQKRSSIVIHLICSDYLAQEIREEIESWHSGAVHKIFLYPVSIMPMASTFDGEQVVRSRSGEITAQILGKIEAPYFAFSNQSDSLFSDHYATVVKALSKQPNAKAGCSGMIVQHRGLDGSRTRNLHSARFVEFDSLTLVNCVDQVGRFVFSSELLKGPFQHLMPLLDGEEHNYFRLAAYLAGPIAQTNQPTYVQDETARALLPVPVEPVEHQRQYIRDLFSRDSKWLAYLDKGVKIPEFVYARGPGSPIRWDQYTPPYAVNHRIALEQWIPTKVGGAGLRYLIAGFAQPDLDSVWLEAERGVIEFALGTTDPLYEEDYEIGLILVGRRSLETGRQQHCTFAINGMVVAYAQVPDTETEIRLRIPINLLQNSKFFRIEIIPDHADRVFDDAGLVVDSRRLSLVLRGLAVFRGANTPPPKFALGAIHSCGLHDLAAGSLVRNFYAPEDGFTWMAGTKGYIRFGLYKTPIAPRLKLRLFGRSSLITGNPQRVKVSVNDTPVGAFTLPSHPHDLIIDLTPTNQRRYYITIECDHAEAVFNEHHEIVDNRLLGIAIYEIGIVEGVSRIEAEEKHFAEDNLEAEE